MFRRNFLKGLLNSIAAVFATRARAATSTIELGPSVHLYDPWHDYQKFVNTPYLDRMDFSQMGYDVSVANIGNKFDYVNRQVLEFREQKPFGLSIKPLWRRKPMKDCWREAVAEINAKYAVKE